MNNLGTLYRFEIKKILKNRVTQVMLVILCIITILEAIVPGLSVTRDKRDARMELNGRIIDDTLLNEMYQNIDDNGHSSTPNNEKYFGICYLEQTSIPGPDNVLADYTADDMYRAREEQILGYMDDIELSDQIITHWKEIMKKTEKPFKYIYSCGSLFLSQGLGVMMLIIMLLSALCLTTVFTIEYRQRTDQIVLSSRNGRKETYLVKLCAGLSVIIASTVFATGLLTVLIFVIYGSSGFDSIVQLSSIFSAYPFSMGQFIIIQMVIMITVVIMYAVFAMVVSIFTKNSLAVMGMMFGAYLFGELDVLSDKAGNISFLRTLMPSYVISMHSLSEYRMLNIGGKLFTIYVASPILYLLISIILTVIGSMVYERGQVNGR